MAKITANLRQAALRRGFLVKTRAQTTATSAIYAAAAIEFANLGFIVSPKELDGISVAGLETALADARKVIGADRDMVPVYPGFPQQVESLDSMTLLIEQILHYWTAGAFLPDYPTIAREGLPLEDMLRTARELKVRVASEAAREMTRALVTNPVALSADDKTLLEGCVELQHPTLEEVSDLVKVAKNGENIQSFVEAVAGVCTYSLNELLSATVAGLGNSDQLLRTVLSLASTASDVKWKENYTLAVTTLADRHARAVRMGRLNRAARRSIVVRLGEVTNGFNADRLVARRDLWRGVLRAVHPYDFVLTEAQKRAVDIVHSNVGYRTLNSLVEGAMESGKVKKVVELLSENQPGNLLRRVVAILRLVKKDSQAERVADAIRRVGVRSSVSTLISAYNGVISANDEHARVTRVAGLNNTMMSRSDIKKVKKDHIELVLEAIRDALSQNLAKKEAPTGVVGVKGKAPVPLVRRDASTTDRVLDRGEVMAISGDGDVLRVFGHWNNNQNRSGYMDIGAVVLDKDFKSLGVCTWDTWNHGNAREWSTYSGDKLVYPGQSASEYVDVKLDKLRKTLPGARYVALTVQSWSGFPIDSVDFVAGAMLRSDGTKGEVFDARSVVTTFKPTTKSLQAVPLVVDLKNKRMTWIDTSNGANQMGVSSSRDATIGPLIYDELKRPRFTLGELAELWANAHDTKTVKNPVDREALLALLD